MSSWSGIPPPARWTSKASWKPTPSTSVPPTNLTCRRARRCRWRDWPPRACWSRSRPSWRRRPVRKRRSSHWGRQPPGCRPFRLPRSEFVADPCVVESAVDAEGRERGVFLDRRVIVLLRFDAVVGRVDLVRVEVEQVYRTDRQRQTFLQVYTQLQVGNAYRADVVLVIVQSAAVGDARGAQWCRRRVAVRVVARGTLAIDDLVNIHVVLAHRIVS